MSTKFDIHQSRQNGDEQKMSTLKCCRKEICFLLNVKTLGIQEKNGLMFSGI